MEQHPIPQQITSYEFKLVGDMTLKQFGKAAGGIIIALLLNTSHLVFFIKWPLMLVSASTGLAMAFVPFQDRPLETWIFSFIKSIYSPTIYIWKKRPEKNWLEIDRTKRLEILNEEKDEEIPQKDEKRVEEFIASLPSVKHHDEVELEEPRTQKAEELVPGLEAVKAPQPETANKEMGGEVKSEDWRNQKLDLNLKTAKAQATGTAVFGAIPMPDTPDVANVLVGMVTDKEGKIVEDAIIEIQDNEGNSVRVLKTNTLGQFKTATQLANGTYLIIPEKGGFKFNNVNVQLAGKIMQPIKIQAMA
ncbi:hypothetical protein M1116_03735 [Patescibacteria group bacterium]|nr:hypothetical protein [Patescibacteria group bacterium]